MSPGELRLSLKGLGLSQIEFSRFLELDERTVRRWCSGERPVPKSIRLLLDLMSRFDVRPNDIG